MEDLYDSGPRRARVTRPGPGDTWKTGGASAWITGHYDPQLNLTYWGTGNTGPWPSDAHPGDNLYANSVIALDADTGKLKGYHQYHWNDSWDWDEVSAPILMDVPRDGRTIKAWCIRRAMAISGNWNAGAEPSASWTPNPP